MTMPQAAMMMPRASMMMYGRHLFFLTTVVCFLAVLISAPALADDPPATIEAATRPSSDLRSETQQSGPPAEEAPQAQREAADWMPSGTLAVARFADVQQFRGQWRESSFGAQTADPAFAEFFDAVAARLSGVSAGLGIDILRLWQDVEGELSVGVIRGASGSLSIVAVANLPDEPGADQFIRRMESSLRADSAELTEVQVGDLQLSSWQRRSAQGLRNLSYFRAGRQIIFSDGLQTLAQTARLGSGSAEALADDPNYVHVINRLTPRGDSTGLNWYVNPTAVIQAAASANMTGGAGADAVGDMIDRLRLDQFRGFGGSFWLGQGGMDSVSSTYGYVETPVEGFWKAFVLPATKQRPPDWVKDDVSIYSQFNWSADRFLGAVAELIDRTQGEGTFERGIGSMPVGDSGLSVGQLAQRLSGPIHIAAEIPQTAAELTRQRAIFAVEVTDAQQIAQLVDSLASGADAEVSEISGQQMYRYRFDTSEIPDLPPLELAVAVRGDTLMFSPSAEFLEATLADRGQRRPLADSPRYQEIAAQFPDQTSMISYQRQDARIEGLYEQLRSGLLGGGLPGQLLNFDFTKLPPFPAMSRYLQSTGSYIVPQSDGFQIVTFATPPREP